MMSKLDDARMALARGDILRTLYEDYTANMTSVRSLAFTLDAMGVALSPEDVDEHLVYLAQQSYVTIWRGRDMPEFRSDRVQGIDPNAIAFTKLTAKGLQLLKGKIPADPMISF